MRRAAVVWTLGLATAVPWATWYLVFEAPREQYAFLITGILFWIFGYWSLVGPVLMGMKARAVLRALERAQSPDDFARTLRSAETRDVAVDLLAGETGLPRFVARRVHDHLLRRIAQREAGLQVDLRTRALPPRPSGKRQSERDVGKSPTDGSGVRLPSSRSGAPQHSRNSTPRPPARPVTPT